MEHLDKTMTEYVLEQYALKFTPKGLDYAEEFSDFCLTKLDRINNLANFLSETLNPSMFVPAVFEDGKWVIFEPLQYCCSGASNQCGCMGMPINVSSMEELQQFQSALENVYFDGFEFDVEEDEFLYIKSNEHKIIFDLKESVVIHNTNDNSDFATKIEDIICLKLKLTPTIQNRLK